MFKIVKLAISFKRRTLFKIIGKGAVQGSLNTNLVKSDDEIHEKFIKLINL